MNGAMVNARGSGLLHGGSYVGARDVVVGRARAVADYVAGMTDRYALSAYARLVGEAPDLEMRAQLKRDEHE